MYHCAVLSHDILGHTHQERNMLIGAVYVIFNSLKHSGMKGNCEAYKK
jgi:hypothetical protein